MKSNTRGKAEYIFTLVVVDLLNQSEDWSQIQAFFQRLNVPKFFTRQS